MADSTSFLDNMRLPGANPHEALETISRNRFKPLFDPKRFEVRSEDYRDKGVDFSIEVIMDKSSKAVYTNFRLIVQLKASDSIMQNTDGSMSVQLETSNINYLLNHSMPAYYVLYHNPTGLFYVENLRDYTSSLAAKDVNWKEQATHTLRFSRPLDSVAIDDMHRQTLQKGIMHRQLNEQTSLLAQSQYPDDKVLLDRDLNIVSEAEIRNMIEKGGFALINKNRGADVIQLHRKASGSMETSGLYNLVVGFASYQTGNMPEALSFFKAARKKDVPLQPGLEHFLTYFETLTKYALGMLSEKQYAEKMELCSNSPTLDFYITLENAKKEYFRNCPQKDALKIFEEKTRKVILDESCPIGLKFSGTLELLFIDGENINMEYIRNISRINGKELENIDVLQDAHRFLNWFHHTYHEWLGKIDEIMQFCTEELDNKFLYQLALITRVRMNYHLLVISREIFLMDENPALPKLEFQEGDQPFLDLLEEAAQAGDYFRGISHVENLTVCLSLQYEIAHYIDDTETSAKALADIEYLVSSYELNIINSAVQRLKSDGPYHETFLKSFEFEGHKELKKMYNQRKELKAMDKKEADAQSKNWAGRDSIMLFPIGCFTFPKEKREIVFEILSLSACAMDTFGYMLDNRIQPVADIHYNPVAKEGYMAPIPTQRMPGSWDNIYRIRKRFYEEQFFRAQT